MRPPSAPAPIGIRTGVSPFGPVVVFVLLSMIFGIATIAITAPLRGPDEAAHFLRAYGMAQGDLIPSQQDVRGRKGAYLPALLHGEFAVYEAAHAKERRLHWSREAKNELQQTDGTEGEAPSSVFVAYEGSEGYTPIVYLPYVAAAWAARIAQLDFVTTMSLMRLAGLAATTALIAYAISIVPYFRWAFVSIAMLPAALYGRAVVSADGMTLALAIVVTAVAVNQALRLEAGCRVQHAVWNTLAALTKPPTLLFALLAGMRCSPRAPLRRWLVPAITVLPGLIAMIAWTVATSGDAATWRVAELTGRAPEEFDAAWKLRFMLAHPVHFPAAVIATLRDAGELWRQLIGVLGLFDTVLQSWTYPALSVLLIAACLTPVDRDAGRRRWIAAVAGATAAAYAAAVFLIFYLVWTPANADQVWGVQGRYFLPCLPLIAIAWCAVNRGLSEPARAIAAIAGATLAGVATVEAILRTDWHFWGS